MWIDVASSSEAASTLETRLGNIGAKVELSKHQSTSIAYSANGVTLHQKETETVSEFRGLTETAAKLLESLTTDGTTSTTYYRTVGSDGDLATACIVSGTKTTYVASRSNEADGWRVTKTATVCAPLEDPTTNGWTVSTQGRALSAEGVSVPVSQDRTATHQFGTSSNALSSIVTTTVTEIRLLTEAGKNAYLAQASNGATIRSHGYTSSYKDTDNVTWYITSASCWFNHGTDIMVSATYVSAEEGWTVTKTVKTYGFTPNNGVAPSNDGRYGTVGWYLV